jgi:hypothetical protein
METPSISGLPLSKKDVDHSTRSPIVDKFSVLQGGPIYRFQLAVRMAMPDRSGVVKRALVTTLLTWFPMLLLSALQHRAFGSEVKITFLYDMAAGLRFLIGLPLLVVAEAIIDPRLNHSVRHFVESGLVSAEDLPAFESVILKTNKLRDNVIPALLIVVAAFLPSFWYQQAEVLRKGVSTWHTIGSPSGESLSLAGWWAGLIALPLYRILLFRWVWMITLWTIFLKRTMSIRLRCVSTHPDTCGGLGFLTDAQLLFGLIAFSVSAVMAGVFGNAIAYEGETISSLKFLIIAFCVLAVIMLAAPLLVLTPRLAAEKRRGLHEYGSLGTAYVQGFDSKWIKDVVPEREPLLGTADIQSLADLSNSFSVIRDMKIVLIDKRLLLGLAIPTILPLIPMVIVATPTSQLVKAVLKLLV